MKTYITKAKLEILVDEIESVAKKETFPFWDDSERLQYISELIKNYNQTDHEAPT